MTNLERTLSLIETLRAQGEAFCVVTIIRTADSTSARPGAKAVVLSSGELIGFVGGGCVTGAVRMTALNCLESGQPEMIRVRPRDQVAADVDADGVPLHGSSCPSGGTVEAFVEPFSAPKRLVIFGASPIAQSVLALAPGLGFRSIVIADEADQAKIPGADQYRATVDAIDTAGFGPADAMIAATQGRGDLAALRAMAASAAGYKGMVCSRKKRAALMTRLRASDPDLVAGLEALHAPAGLDIGAIEPEEIALSILTEIVQHQRRGSGAEAPRAASAMP